MTTEEKIAEVEKVIKSGEELLNRFPELDYNNYFETSLNPSPITIAVEQWESECSKMFDNVMGEKAYIYKQNLSLTILGEINGGKAHNDYGNYRNAIKEGINQLKDLERVLNEQKNN